MSEIVPLALALVERSKLDRISHRPSEPQTF
jgi:hypothetical protein